MLINQFIHRSSKYFFCFECVLGIRIDLIIIFGSIHIKKTKKLHIILEGIYLKLIQTRFFNNMYFFILFLYMSVCVCTLRSLHFFL